MANAVGAGGLIAVDKRHEVLEIARSMGAEYAIQSDGERLCEAVSANCGGREIDIVYDTIGGEGDCIAEGLKMVRRGGMVVVVAPYFTNISIPFSLLSGERTLTETSCYGTYGTHLAGEIVADFLSRRKIDVRPMITHRFPIDAHRQAFDVAENKEKHGAVKVVINP